MKKLQIILFVVVGSGLAVGGCSGGSDASPAQVAKMKAALENKHQPTIEEEKQHIASLSPEMRAKVIHFIPHEKQVELGLAPK